MAFIEMHVPNCVADLVFKDPYQSQIIKDYADGKRTKHLLLYGPAGSGKSEAAKIILRERLDDLSSGAFAKPINPKLYKFGDFNPLMMDWNYQMMQGSERGYSVIDEVDLFADEKHYLLRAFIDSTKLGTLICTTNNLHRLDDAFQDRFFKLMIERPSANDWIPRAQHILACEGMSYDKSQVSTLLKGFNGSARDLIDWLEEYTLRLGSSLPKAHGQIVPFPTPK